MASIQDILDTTGHRPWHLPAGTWRFYQEWNRAIFIHWMVDAQILRNQVPSELEIDLYDGKAWVSLVAFTMEKIRPKSIPPVAPISNFNEINLRTYVKFKNKAGVYFLSIEAGSRLSSLVARRISELPYRYSRINRTPNVYTSNNSSFQDHLNIEFQIGNPVYQKSDLDLWLTERYALFQDTIRYINAFEIHHLEWPIQELNKLQLEFNYRRFTSLIAGKPDRSHYSQGVQVLAWPKQKWKRDEKHGRDK